MREIRICRKMIDAPGEPVEHGLWMPESPSAKAAFHILVQAGNEKFGAGTHWLETREREGQENV